MTTTVRPPLHVAIIPDGNGRWAAARGKPRGEGHRAGVEAARRVIAAAPELGIGTLTLFAFSSDNFQRPPREVEHIFALLREFLRHDAPEWRRNGIELRLIGRRDRWPATFRLAAGEAETSTRFGERMKLRLAVDYSGREAILRAACRLYTSLEVSRAAFSQMLGRVTHAGEDSPEVDLLIRAGGEQRLSDFLLWEAAYAELYFTKKWWPDFQAEDLADAVAEFHSRTRRFGTLPEAAAS
ncbi:MAG TPA: polyprenyl diphosphate synthase [Candidatus Nitrosotenuis sp.]|nr:polyprenyl diphosphate synthase [Candidatus Nitrosotenuis sp.]